MNYSDKRIIRHLCDNYRLSVRDCEGLLVSATSNPQQVIEGILSVEESKVRVWESKEKLIGELYFTDEIFDYTISMENILKGML